MKKLMVAILAVAVLAAAVLPFAVFASGDVGVAKAKKDTGVEITRNPVERTFPRGSDLVYSVETKYDVKYEWHLLYNEEDLDLTTQHGIEKAKALAKNPSGDVAQEIIGADTGTLRLKGFWIAKEAKAQVYCMLTGKNNSGEVAGPVSIRLFDAVDDTLQPPEIKMTANVYARENTVIKLACNVEDPEGFEYDAYAFTWYVLENGAAKEIPDEDGMILIVDQGLGRREYKCRVTAIVSGTQIDHETMWTPVEIYVPSVEVSYSTRNVTLKAGKTATVEAEYEITRPDDEGKVSFQWYKSDKADGVYKPVEGATKAELELTGTGEAGEEYYFCVVVNEPWYQNREGDLEGTRYESEFSSTNVVKVVYKDGTSSGGVNMAIIFILALGVFAILLLTALIVLLVVLIKKKK